MLGNALMNMLALCGLAKTVLSQCNCPPPEWTCFYPPTVDVPCCSGSGFLGDSAAHCDAPGIDSRDECCVTNTFRGMAFFDCCDTRVAQSTVTDCTGIPELDLIIHTANLAGRTSLFQSQVYTFEGFCSSLRDFNRISPIGEVFLGNTQSQLNIAMGLTNIAAILAQTMVESGGVTPFQFCDENNSDNRSATKYFKHDPLTYNLSSTTAECGQGGEDYNGLNDPPHCEIDPDMQITATTVAQFVLDNNEGPMQCAPQTPTEGCCWWGRGAIQTTGPHNYALLQQHIISALGIGVDLCVNPGAICESPALNFFGAFYYWADTVQKDDCFLESILTYVRNDFDESITATGCPSFPTGISGAVNGGSWNEIPNDIDRRLDFFRGIMSDLVNAGMTIVEPQLQTPSSSPSPSITSALQCGAVTCPPTGWSCFWPPTEGKNCCRFGRVLTSATCDFGVLAGACCGVNPAGLPDCCDDRAPPPLPDSAVCTGVPEIDIVLNRANMPALTQLFQSTLFSWSMFCDQLVRFNLISPIGPFLLGDSLSSKGVARGLVNIAAFLAVSMTATGGVRHFQTCDEDNFLFNPGGACGQNGISYNDLLGTPRCAIDGTMDITAGSVSTTFSRLMRCQPGDESEGCCWWGRGALQTTGPANYAIFQQNIVDQLSLGEDLCVNPQAVCELEDLRFLSGLHFWVHTVQEDNCFETIRDLFVDSNFQRDQSGQGCAPFEIGISGSAIRGSWNSPNDPLVGLRRLTFLLLIHKLRFAGMTLIDPTPSPTPSRSANPSQSLSSSPTATASLSSSPSASRSLGRYVSRTLEGAVDRLLDEPVRVLVPEIGATNFSLGYTDPALRSTSLQMTVASLKEFSAAGEQVGIRDKPIIDQHATTAAKLALVLAVFDRVRDETISGVAARTVSFDVDLVAGAILHTKLSLFLSDGTVTLRNRTVEVHEGAVLIVLEIRLWPFCETGGVNATRCIVSDALGGGVVEEIGDELRLLVEFVASSTTQKVFSTLALGGNATLSIFDSVTIDGLDRIVDTSATIQDGIVRVQVPFPKFSNFARVEKIVNIQGVNFLSQRPDISRGTTSVILSEDRNDNPGRVTFELQFNRPEPEVEICPIPASESGIKCTPPHIVRPVIGYRIVMLDGPSLISQTLSINSTDASDQDRTISLQIKNLQRCSLTCRHLAVIAMSDSGEAGPDSWITVEISDRAVPQGRVHGLKQTRDIDSDPLQLFLDLSWQWEQDQEWDVGVPDSFDVFLSPNSSTHGIGTRLVVREQFSSRTQVYSTTLEESTRILTSDTHIVVAARNDVGLSSSASLPIEESQPDFLDEIERGMLILGSVSVGIVCLCHIVSAVQRRPSVKISGIETLPPWLLIQQLQFFDILGQLNTTLPSNLRAGTQTFRWTNLNFDFPNTLPASAPASLPTENSRKLFDVSDLPTYDTLPPESLLENVIYAFVLFALVLAISVVIYNAARKGGRLPSGLQGRKLNWKLVSLFVRGLSIAYFGVTYAAINQLHNGNSTRWTISAGVLLLVISLGLPALNIYAVKHRSGHRENLAEMMASRDFTHKRVHRLETVFKPVLNDWRQGLEWFGILILIRLLMVALLLVVLTNNQYSQICVIMAIYTMYLLIMRVNPYRKKLLHNIDMVLTLLDVVQLLFPVLLMADVELIVENSTTVGWIMLGLQCFAVLTHVVISIYTFVLHSKKVWSQIGFSSFSVFSSSRFGRGTSKRGTSSVAPGLELPRVETGETRQGTTRGADPALPPGPGLWGKDSEESISRVVPAGRNQVGQSRAVIPRMANAETPTAPGRRMGATHNTERVERGLVSRIDQSSSSGSSLN